ncbi:MAG: hypothetical protein CM15mP102_16910 [Flavobacteriales bacterium]|nr:MAG: hypothetical protein CM15mP102_16910 [Flavobacteriales bacterium]
MGTPPENSLKYYSALRKFNIPAAIHIWEDGGHGYGLAKTGVLLNLGLKLLKSG